MKNLTKKLNSMEKISVKFILRGLEIILAEIFLLFTYLFISSNCSFLQFLKNIFSEYYFSYRQIIFVKKSLFYIVFSFVLVIVEGIAFDCVLKKYASNK